MFEIFQIDRSSVQQIKNLTAEGAKIIKNNSYLGSDLLKTTPMPQILFTDLKDSKRLGYYDSTQNLIVLSAALQEEGCETSLHNVYLHELAHYCDYVINGQSAHDTTFRQICRALDVREEYSGAKVKETAQNRQKIKSRIEKLLNLSASDFEGEATLAMNKARTLMEKYGVGENTRDMLYPVPLGSRCNVLRQQVLVGVIDFVVCIAESYLVLMGRYPKLRIEYKTGVKG